MKPSQIRVFDGLRITTDHVNHLQGAFYSGLEDFREILGLGKAQVGLEVAAQDDNSITIQPGLAFHFEKNRLPVDAPQTVKLDFATPEEVKYICLKHAQVDEGAVEGHPTMIWDSSTVVVRTAAPDAKEGLVTLARVSKTADGKLYVCPVERGYHHKAPEVQPPPSTPVTPGMPPPAAAPPAPEAAPAKPAPETAAPPSPGFQVRQGVVQLSSDTGANLVLKTVLAPALRQKMGADPIELAFTLAKADLNPDIAVAGFTTHCLLSADLTLPAAPDAPPNHYRLQSAATGEATVGAGSVAQFAVSAIEASPLPAQPGLLWSATDFTGRGLAQFAFGQWLDAPETARPPLAAEIFSALDLVVQLDRTAGGFQLALKLLWNGKTSEESTHTLETQDLGFTWGLIFGWKAIGN
jgi:hypothetical protein